MSGREIVQTVGCLACHVLDGVGTSGPWGGPDFAELAGKRTAAHWREWLENPAQLNSRHRMPLFPLIETERVVVADWLEGLTPFAGERETPAQGQGDQREASPASKERGPGPEPLAMGDATRGVALLRRHRCVACHELPAGAAEDSLPQSQPAGKAGQPGAAPALASLAGDAARGCLAAQAPVSAQQPWYRLSEAERGALLRFVNAKSTPWPNEGGGTIWARRGCANCHSRDGSGGLRGVISQLVEREPGWRGQTEGLLPPDLSAVGDKLRDDWLRQAVAGEQPRRLPWLRVRMPRFAHADADREMLARWLVQADRIPPHAPGGDLTSLAELAATAEGPEWRAGGLVAGGSRGFSCVGCHKVGPYEPRGVGLATRGSDLYRVDQRLRPEFFSRWVRGPLRVVPNHEMPAFVRPLEGVLEGRLDRQLAALWKVLSEPGKPPQFDTSTIEQAPVPAPG
ncbi:MAG: hypothetical protein ACKO3P_05835, partial [Planctomycetaceae bacterium]